MDQQTSVTKTFFLGRIPAENLFPFPRPVGSTNETLGLVVDSVERFLSGKDALHRKFDEQGAQPADYIESLKELGLFSLVIPEEYGGIGLNSREYARVVEQLARHDGSTTLTVAAHSSIGMKGLLLFGNEEQKKRYLPKLATGELIAAFCLTEAGAGSDAASIKTSAVKQADGSWILNGEKIWITNGPIADFFTVFARTESERGKITAFLVERSFPGVSSGPKEDKLGIRASATSTVTFQDVRIPPANVLGEEGHGFKVAMSILNHGRTGLGGGTVGAMKHCINLAIAQAAGRKQFGKSIAEYGLVQEKIARMTMHCFVAESLVSMVGHYIDSGVEDYSCEAAICKIYNSEALWSVVNDALQIAGGNGFMKDFPYERVLRDSRINLIFEGTNEILRLYIALSGLKAAGEYLKEIGEGFGKIFNDPIKGFGVLSSYAGKRFLEITRLGGDRLDHAHPSLSDLSSVFERGVQQLGAGAAQVLKRHRKNIVDKQFAQRRLADVAIDLFAGAAMISRLTSILETRQAPDELLIAKLFTEQARIRIAENLRAIEREDDKWVESIASSISAAGRYPWDI